ncbi:MAG: hypothetical protein NTY96_09000, partial [Bacteroidetes bacterium]|nr:hypothetical protein [Bacteroidota bacterium]
MLCIAVDVDNENHLLAGSASGGMWESNTEGNLWHKVTAPDAEQSATCIAQDRRPGKHSTWYYGSGELLSTTNRNVSTSVRTVGLGNGIFKSTDNGTTWQALPSTQGGQPGVLKDVFQGVWRIVTDPVTMNKDIVYAACYGAIMRSENGGQTWTMVLGDLVNKSFASDIAVTTNGTLYAVLSGYGWSIEPPGRKGIWRSANGINWTEITPKGFPADNRATKLAIAASNENVVYVLTESQSPDLNPFNGYTNSVNTFWKMSWNAAADSAVWENRTTGIPGAGNGSMNSWPFSFVCYGGYCLTLGVKPDNENDVFLGGMSLFRSDNGFADSLHTANLGGCPYDMDSIHEIHPDQHGITFLPSNPNTMFMANDGGIYRTTNCTADSAHISWDRQNARLTTTQFYSVAIDHGASAEDWVLGGLQDNNWYYTVTNNPSEFWFNIDICYDGFAVALAPSWEYCVISAYSGNIWTSQFDASMHTKNIFPQLPDTLLKYYDPVMGSNELFPFYQNFALDPNTSRTFYLPTINSIWRKDDLKASAMDSSQRNAGWNHLSNVDIGNASTLSAISVSRFPANRLYYGTSLGKLYRLDNANTGNPMPVDISGSNFPAEGFVACIDINPLNANEVVVVFSNYSVLSLFYSADGGAAWTSVSGNLEEHPDGSGAGPSVRWAKQLTYQGEKVVFIGTSVGLYSTTKLNGDSTIWIQESPDAIGNVIVDMIDARSTDGFVAIATHGNGVYSTYYKPSSGISDPEGSRSLVLLDPFPVPAHDVINLLVETQVGCHLEIRLTSSSGADLGLIWKGTLRPGRNNIPVNLIQLSSYPLPAGVYYITAATSSAHQTKKIIVM